MPTAAGVEWREEAPAGAVRERRFTLWRDARPIPGLLWTPLEGSGPWPLVLLGHGGSGSKDEGYVVTIARGLATTHRVAAAAIDGPVHGDRRKDPDATSILVIAQFAQLWASDGEAMTETMVADWRAVLSALL